MKTKLLYLFLSIPAMIFSQVPIAGFNSLSGSNYAEVTSSGSVDQTTSGPNLTWNFTDLVATGTQNEDTYNPPTPVNLSNYPGTTNVATITNTNNPTNINYIFEKIEMSTVSLTGVERDDLQFNYTNNALIGTFPLSYNTVSSDPVSGSFTIANTQIGTIVGTFNGTIDVVVDAYGTLQLNDIGEGSYIGSVTRLKVVQNLTLNATSPFPVSAAAAQTSYYYYDNNNNNLMFRTNNFVVGLLNVNETVMESLLPLSTLNIAENNLESRELTIVPNPVKDVLNIHLSQNETISSIVLIDLSGRQVLSINDHLTSISVSNLKAGMYIANIATDKGVYSKKILKK
jgi:hypothetical protein